MRRPSPASPGCSDRHLLIPRPAGKRHKNDKGEVGPFVFKKYKDVHADVVLLASALRQLLINPGQRVGVYGANCPEWMEAMQVTRPPARAPATRKPSLQGSCVLVCCLISGAQRPVRAVAWRRQLTLQLRRNNRPQLQREWAARKFCVCACLARRRATACPSSACRCTTLWARTPSSTSSTTGDTRFLCPHVHVQHASMCAPAWCMRRRMCMIVSHVVRLRL